MSKENIYICDIDNTIANHREVRGPFDEHLVHLDTPLPTINIIKALIATGDKIVYISGRSDECYNGTIEWITKYIDDQPPELYMRKSRDFRSDDIVKLEIYQNFIRDKYNVLGVFDDRLKVVRMWQNLGLWVYDVAQGKGDF